jgi:hypothetical protein
MGMHVDSDVRATAAQLAAASSSLRTLADAEGLSDLRLSPDGTLFAHVDNDPTYRSVLRFVAAATQLLGVEPNVVVDHTPAALAKLPASSPL